MPGSKKGAHPNRRPARRRAGLVLVTGATGYVGGRLVPRLLEAGYRVRCLVRDPDRLQGHAWLAEVQVAQGDVLDRAALRAAMRGVSVAYYLIHGLQGGLIESRRDVEAAHNFAGAAEEAGVERIVYLGELVDPAARLSPYLRSRHETGYALRQGRVPVTEFRAGMIVGSGSALFEMIRYLTEREPVMVCPRWFFSRAQPIAVRDVLSYLVAALECPPSVGKWIEIGGATRLRYADMLMGYAAERGLKRLLIPTPVHASRLSAYWVHMVTPVHWRAVLPLIEGLHADSLVRDELARELFPQIEPIDFRSAVRLALGRIQSEAVETSWSDSLVSSAGDVQPYKLVQQEGMMIERRQLVVDLPTESVYRAYTGLGGGRGWLYLNWAWVVRGWIDKLVGGVGLRRGRRHPDELRVGESLDFWRVEALEPGRLLRLRAEMRVPGRAWLQFHSVEMEPGRTLLTQVAYFAPRGFSGFLYWYSLYPIHTFMFSGLIRRIARRAEDFSKPSSAASFRRG
jgi:uncharacterized protein YbjT (DUF2867 family)